MKMEEGEEEEEKVEEREGERGNKQFQKFQLTLLGNHLIHDGRGKERSITFDQSVSNGSLHGRFDFGPGSWVDTID